LSLGSIIVCLVISLKIWKTQAHAMLVLHVRCRIRLVTV
jgi:hypothetical protein